MRSGEIERRPRRTQHAYRLLAATDLRTPTRLGERLALEAADEQVRLGQGFDHCLSFDDWSPGRLRGVAHAGCHGDQQARITALQLRPVQLRIAAAVAG